MHELARVTLTYTVAEVSKQTCQPSSVWFKSASFLAGFPEFDHDYGNWAAIALPKFSTVDRFILKSLIWIWKWRNESVKVKDGLDEGSCEQKQVVQRVSPKIARLQGHGTWKITTCLLKTVSMSAGNAVFHIFFLTWCISLVLLDMPVVAQLCWKRHLLIRIGYFK